MSSPTVDLDHNATTPLRGAALEAMLGLLRGDAANPSSAHRLGSSARAALDRARRTLAELLGAAPDEIVFTSGGTESNNLALRGRAALSATPEIATSPIEHPSVAKTASACARVHSLLAADDIGAVDPRSLQLVAARSPCLVSVQAVNHEIGTVQPLPLLSAQLAGTGIPLHVDAAQAFGKIPFRVDDPKIDLATLSAHKLGGPVGIGALYVRRGVALAPQLTGGAQEDGRRAGTPAVALAAGFAAAAAEAIRELPEVLRRHDRLRTRLAAGLRAAWPGILFHSALDGRSAPGTLSVAFPGVPRDALVVALDLAGFAISAGAACATGSPESSPVLEALHVPRTIADCSVRISFGRTTSESEIDRFLGSLPAALTAASRSRGIL